LLWRKFVGIPAFLRTGAAMLGQIGQGIHRGIVFGEEAAIGRILSWWARVCCSYLGQTPAVKLRIVVEVEIFVELDGGAFCAVTVSVNSRNFMERRASAEVCMSMRRARALIAGRTQICVVWQTPGETSLVSTARSVRRCRLAQDERRAGTIGRNPGRRIMFLRKRKAPRGCGTDH